MYCIVFYPLSKIFNYFHDGLSYIQKNTPYFNLCNKAYKEIKEYKKRLPKKIKFYIMKNQESNAMVFSSRKIAISQDILDFALECEEGYEIFKGILAHECGHIFYKDLVATIMLRAAIIPIKIIIYIFTGIISILFSFIFSSNKGSDSPTLYDFFNVIIEGIVRFANIIGGKREEKKADLFAVKVDAGEGLLTFFFLLEENGHKGDLFDEHPVTSKRIEYMEKAIHES